MLRRIFRPFLPQRRLWLLFLVGMLSVCPAGAQGDPELTIDLHAQVWTGDLDDLAAHRAIRVLVPYSRTLYFVDLGAQQRGMAYDFMHDFEADLNEKLKRGNLQIHCVFIPVSREQLLPMLIAGKGDVVAANLTITPERRRRVDFVAPVAHGVREIIVTGPSGPELQSLDDLSGKEVFAQRTTSYYESLRNLNDALHRRGKPGIRLREAPSHFETEDMLEMVNAGLVGTVVADDYLARFWKQVYPQLTLHDDLAVREDGEIAFAIRKSSPKLKAALDAFTEQHKVGTLFGNVELRKYLSQTRWARNSLEHADLARFNQMVALFRRYGAEYKIDWLLMAAQGYQESQLDQSRRSGAGAIGVMQLTPSTAKQMDVGDITQLEPNIHAGVKYVRLLADNYYNDGHIDSLNRVLFAFAAYNAGPGRIRSARKAAIEQHLDPNVWFDNVERAVATQVGRETVQYVSNIYKYFIAYSLVEEDVARNLEHAALDSELHSPPVRRDRN